MMRVLVITNSQAFYKINLYEKLSENMEIFLIDTGDKRIQRNFDFLSRKDSINVVKKQKNIFGHIFYLLRIRKSFDKVFVGGWENSRIVVSYFLFPKARLISFIESSVNESRPNIFLDYIKRFLLSKVSVVLYSGVLQKELLNRLQYRGSSICSGGVGLINEPKARTDVRLNQRKFVYIGRFVKAKNVELLIEAFRLRPNLSLVIIGEGEILRDIPPNVKPLGYKRNTELIEVFDKTSCLILPSLHEPWGLVVEEALYHGLAVILSGHVGCLGSIGKIPEECIFNPNSVDSLLSALDYISSESNLMNFVRKYDRTYQNHVEDQLNAYNQLIK